MLKYCVQDMTDNWVDAGEEVPVQEELSRQRENYLNDAKNCFFKHFQELCRVACHCMSLGLTMFVSICNWWL